LARPVVIKIQARTTGPRRPRPASPSPTLRPRPPTTPSDSSRSKSAYFPVTEGARREKLEIARELFRLLSIDDRERCPVLLVSLTGGSGIEERAGQVQRFVCDVSSGPDRAAIDRFLASSDIPAAHRGAIADALQRIFTVAKTNEARSVEVNPLVITADGKVMAADCRITIDDYAVFRHPDLNIDIAANSTTRPPRSSASPTTSNKPTIAAPSTSPR